ncbi:ABC transporter substrate-binding protein [Alicyclobacillus acidiphilus]|uniref:ABC transporter substrate-binding protein n=1 Tax=Alicyclobacillus acidiphilus TaxID=182455 RepID=UPI00082AE9F1|nr:ABC transporter substrate-binding protein [Alicyclobacillus acidiphilus]
MKRLAVWSASLVLTASTAATGVVISVAQVSAATAVQSGPPLTIVTAPGGNFQDNFNPFSSGNSGTLGLVYETMFYFDNISGKQFNLLGTKFAFSNADKTLTVTLHPNVKWTDGHTFSASDVVFTFDLLKKYPDADTNGVWGQLASVKAEGSQKVVFQFKKADVPFAETYVLGDTYIVPQHIWSKLGDPTKVRLTKPIGTGPFKLNSYSPQVYTFVPNQQYYLGVPKESELKFPAYASNASADLALADGQIQWAGVNIPNVQKDYTSHSPHNHYWFPPNQVMELYANLSDPLLKQLPVREAISMALDRHKIDVFGESGYVQPAVPTSLDLPNYKAWLNPKLPASGRAFVYSPAKAIQILKQAGYKKDANGIMAKGGKELSLSLDVVSGWSDNDEDALIIEQNLAAIGIKVKVNQLQFANFYNAILPSGNTKKDYQLAIAWTQTGPTPYTQYYDMLDPKGGFNVSGFSNPAVTKLLDDYASTASMSRQKNDIYQIEDYLVKQMPVIPLYDQPAWYEYNDTDYTGWPNASDPWINPNPQNWQSAEIILEHLKPRN